MPEFPIRWKIPNIDTVDERRRGVVKLILNVEWTLVCIFKQYQRSVWSCTSIEFHRNSTAGEFSISGVLTCIYKGSVLWHRKISHLIKTGSSFEEIISNINKKFYINSWLVGKLNISNINVKHLACLANGETKEKIQLKSLQELSNDLERLLNPGSSFFADVTLKCSDVSIPAHKLILSTRSPVFAAMFSNPMKESYKNEVDITDIDASILRALLSYMYTGKTSDLTVSSAADLLFAADKYQLLDLKAVCSVFLKDAMSVQNVWRILVLGDLHFEDLKSFAMDYICNNCGEFSVLEKTQEWKTLRKERPDLAMELLEALVKYRDEKLKR